MIGRIEAEKQKDIYFRLTKRHKKLGKQKMRKEDLCYFFINLKKL